MSQRLLTRDLPIELLLEAVRIQPDLWAAHAELGVNMLRVNRIAEAMSHLETAYRGDPFTADSSR